MMIMLKQTLKALYILALVGIFINYFGFPNFKKLLEEKTIFAEKKIKVSLQCSGNIHLFCLHREIDRRHGTSRDIVPGIKHKD